MQELKRCHASLAAGDRAELAQMLITLWELIAVRCTSPPSSIIQRVCEDLKQELWGGHQSPPLPVHSAAIFPPPFLPEDRNDMVGKAEYSSLCCPFVPLPNCMGMQGYFHDRATHLGVSAISGRSWCGPGGMLALCFAPQNCCWALTV